MLNIILFGFLIGIGFNLSKFVIRSIVYVLASLEEKLYKKQ